MKQPRSSTWFRVALVAALVALTALCLHSHASDAERPKFEAYNAAGLRPAAPTNLSISVGGGPPPLAYQGLLDGLSSPDAAKRQQAAEQLYDRRAGYTYDVARLIKFVHDSNVRVQQWVSSVIVLTSQARADVAQNLGTYSDQIRGVLERSTDPLVRANCIALLTLPATEFSQVAAVIERAIISGSAEEIHNAAIAVKFFAPASIDLYEKLVAAIPKHTTNQALIADAMLRIALAFRETADTGVATKLNGGAYVLHANSTTRQQGALISDIAARIQSSSDGSAGPNANRTINKGTGIQLSDLDPALFIGGDTLINGRRITASRDSTNPDKIMFLGSDFPLLDGLNFIESLQVKKIVWFEAGLLRNFPAYQNSYAIICAIDDYSFTGGKYSSLGNMVANAKRLAGLLIRLGFPPQNILELPDKKATRPAIEEVLQKFWQGEQYAQCDRLVFYFGGHGDYEKRGDSSDSNKTGILITANYDAQRPTTTGLLMRDLTGRHFENIHAKHVLMLVDACSSGLALPRFQSSDPTNETLSKFRNYVLMETELGRAARNIIVAGTGDQKAMWVNGGIFTQALIDGLNGRADHNRDRLIEFDELTSYVRREVHVRATAANYNQEPRSFRASTLGLGGVLFYPTNPTSAGN